MKSLHYFLLIFSIFLTSCIDDTKDKKQKDDEAEEITVKLPELFFGHYTGTIGEDDFFLNLKKSGNILTAYYFTAENQKVAELEGKVDENGKFYIVGSEETKQNVRFDGQFVKENQAKGKCKYAGSQEAFDFRFAENYDKALAFEIQDINDSLFLFGRKDNPSATLHFSYLKIKNTAKTELQTIQKIIDKMFFETEKVEQNTETNIRNYKNKYFELYKENELGVDSNEVFGQEMNWARENITNVLYNEKGFLSVEIAFYDMSGGAHPNSANLYLVFDTKTGKQIGLEDIFVENYSGRLTNIITNLIAEKIEKSGKAKPEHLTEVGFFDDLIAPNTNFYINEDGIGFYYNAYEIAPYAMGKTDVFVPFISMSELIKSDSPTKKLR